MSTELQKVSSMSSAELFFSLFIFAKFFQFSAKCISLNVQILK